MGKFFKKTFLWLLALLLCLGGFSFAAAENEEAKDILGECALSFSNEKGMERVLDGYINTYAVYQKGDAIEIKAEAPIGALYVEWNALPNSVQLEWRDNNGLLLSTETAKPRFLNEVYNQSEKNCVSCKITFTGETAVSGLTLFGKGALPSSLQQWESSLAEPAVLLAAGYPGDELLCFGGLLPALINEGVGVSVLYMASYSRQRQEEALSALWSLGLTGYPVFLGIETNRSLDKSYLINSWNKAGAVNLLKNAINEYNPKVIVTHGEAGAFSLAQTEITGAMVLNAVKGAAQKKDGWKVEKVYTAKEGEGGAAFSLSLGMYEGKTGYEKAKEAYALHSSQTLYHFTPLESVDFTLAFSTVGEDTQTGLLALLENVEYTPLYTPCPTASPTPSPTVEPTEAPTAAPTAEPVVEAAAETPAPTSAPEKTEEKQSAGISATALLLGGFILLLLLGGGLYLLKTFVKPEIPVLFLWLTPLIGALLLGGAAALSVLQKQEAEASPTPAPTAVTETASPSPTITPFKEATPEPETETPAPTAEEASPSPSAADVTAENKWAEHFLKAGEEEYFTADTDKGYWEYKSVDLSVTVNRYATKEPLVYFIADIYLGNGVDAFRAGFGNEGRTGRTSEAPWKIARRNRAVLLFTGDNMLNMDIDYKGVMIRDGRVYSVYQNADVMVWHPESLSIELIQKKTFLAEDLLAAGVENCFSFGPILKKDGEVTKNLASLSLAGKNPRTAVGMVEPGHFVVIVVDGRREEYSVGVTFDELVTLFEPYGCTDIYNLDGGVSACMIFMGEQLNSHGNIKDYSKQRNLPDGLLFGYSSLVPTEDMPIYNDGIDEG